MTRITLSFDRRASGLCIRRIRLDMRLPAPSSPPSTCAAIGAATRPPVASSPSRGRRRSRRAPRSRTAGLSAGANAMNHACAVSPCHLRGPGLARDLDARDLRRASRCRCSRRRPSGRAPSPRSPVPSTCWYSRASYAVPRIDLAVAVLDVTEHVRHHHHAAVRHGLRDHRHAQRRDRDVGPGRSPPARTAAGSVWNVPCSGPTLRTTSGRRSVSGGRACSRRSARCPVRTCRRGRGRSARTSCCTTRGTTARACRRTRCRRSSRACGRSAGGRARAARDTPGCRP